jgi:hypothetical protein
MFSLPGFFFPLPGFFLSKQAVCFRPMFLRT